MSVQDIYNKRVNSFNQTSTASNNIAVRKDLRTSTTLQSDFIKGVKILKQTGIYDQFVSLHMEAMPEQGTSVAHRGPAFLPWHRRFLFEFELHMANALDQPNYGLPYWNWPLDVDKGLRNSAFWKAGFLGGFGTPVGDGPFAGNQWAVHPYDPVNDPTVTGLVRLGDNSFKPLMSAAVEFNTDSRRSTDIGQGVVNVGAYDSAPYDISSPTGFRNQMERKIHDQFHAWIGGQMNNNFSPDDPAFFLHHCFMDRLWARWQWENDLFGLLQGKPNYPEGNIRPGHNLREPLFWDANTPWNGKKNISDMQPISDTRPNLIDWLNHENLGYRYDDERTWSNTVSIVGFPGYRGAIGSVTPRQVVTVSDIPLPPVTSAQAVKRSTYSFVLRPGPVVLDSTNPFVLSSAASKNVMIQYDPNFIPFGFIDPDKMSMDTARYPSYQTGLYLGFIEMDPNLPNTTVMDIIYLPTEFVGQATDVNRNTLLMQTFELINLQSVQQSDSLHPNVFGLRLARYGIDSRFGNSRMVFQDGSRLRHDRTRGGDQNHAFSLVPFPVGDTF